MSITIESLQTDVQSLRHELELNEEKMQMMVQYPGDKDSLDGEGGYYKLGL